MGETRAADTDFGLNLYRFLQNEWDTDGITRGAWCRRKGLADSTVLRWSQGYAPSMENLVVVADVVNVTLPQLLVECGYIDKKTSVAAPIRRERPTVADAIELDPSLDDNERAAFRAMYQALRSAKDGKKRTTRITVKG